MKCRYCGTSLNKTLIDLGSAPLSNAYLTQRKLKEVERWFPLHVMVCNKCWLVQTEDFASFDEMFDSEYAYYSSFSKSWLEHAAKYKDEMVSRFKLDESSHVVEVAANDGYLLQYFQQSKIPCLGVEPTASTANAAREKGLEIIEEFFGESLATALKDKGHSANLMVANNVLAHVPDINDFVSGFRILLKPDGVATFEFPWLLNMLNKNQFDTIYHEHFSYLSLLVVSKIFTANGLNIFDVEELPTHGGSLRVFAQRSDNEVYKLAETVQSILARENAYGLNTIEAYENFRENSESCKNDLVQFLIEAKKQGKSVVGYGAAAKGNTFLNYAGIRSDLLAYIVDRNPAKANNFMPGSRIPIVDETHIKKTRPDYILILPWNLKEEIMAQLSYVNTWDAKFVTAIPEFSVI